MRRFPFFDAATAMLVMHFLPGDGPKDRFAREISLRFKPGAKFVLADLEGEAADEKFSSLVSAWKRRPLSFAEDSQKVEETFESIMKTVRFRSEGGIGKSLKTRVLKRRASFFSAV